MKDKIYIFGHKNPDTDSVCASLTLSYLYNELGYNTEARILSHINEETKFVLNKLKIKTPELLSDVKLDIGDINYHRGFMINHKESVYNAFKIMNDNNMSSIPIVNDDNKFLGVFAMKDIAKKQILDNNELLETSYSNVLEVLKGKEILKIDNEIKGEIINISVKSNAFNNELFNNNSILILSGKENLVEEAIKQKIELLIITNGNHIKEDYIKLAKANKVNIIETKLSTYETILKIGFANYTDKYQYTSNIVCVNETMELSDLNDEINKSKHSYYPVINNKKICLGLLKVSDLSDKTKKKVILVDHNEINQSVYGLEEAEIIGIIDHHKLGNLGTNTPINFRNMTVGSTCTIIYHLYKENKVKITKEIGTLLLAGLVSDTLLLKSPTTTKDDEKVLDDLVKITGINAKKFAIEMFKASDAANSKSLKEIVYTDFKVFNIDKKTVAVSQITTLNAKAILKQKSSYIRFLNKECTNKGYDLMLLAITDIFQNGSYLLFNTNSHDIIKKSFGDNIEQGDFIKNVISRKKQILPPLMNSIH